MAAEIVLKSTYMDDSMDSVEAKEGGIELYRQLEELRHTRACCKPGIRADAKSDLSASTRKK